MIELEKQENVAESPFARASNQETPQKSIEVTVVMRDLEDIGDVVRASNPSLQVDR